MEENLDEHKTLVDLIFLKIANPVGITGGKRGVGPGRNSDSTEDMWGGLGSSKRLTRVTRRQSFGGSLPPVCTAPWDGAWCLLKCCVRMGHLVPPCTIFIQGGISIQGAVWARKALSAAVVTVEDGLLGC